MKNIILLGFVVLVLIGCSDKDESDWTILIYMAADNSLNNEALADIEDMMQAEFSDNINVIVQVDHSETNVTPAAYRYQLFPESKEQISYLGEIDSGDENQLTSFANWGFNKFPSSKQALILWSHGNGWYQYFCPDVEAENYIGIADGELRNGIKNINDHLEILIFDACNMQTVEVATEIYNYADYIIASEGGVNSAGFPYAEILSSWEEQTASENLCREIGFQYHKFYSDQGIYPFSCSVLKTSEFSQLLDRLTQFTSQWTINASDEIFIESRQNCLEFNDGGYTNPPLDVDIKEFFTIIFNTTENDLLGNFANDILIAIESCYIFQKTDIYPTGYSSDDVGTSIIWFPDMETQGFFNIRKEEYQQLQFSETNWHNFLENSFVN
ncbi:MAG: clostripain-related cysteine peptidase [Candidatus Heimdallarchaeota archaeon]